MECYQWIGTLGASPAEGSVVSLFLNPILSKQSAQTCPIYGTLLVEATSEFGAASSTIAPLSFEAARLISRE